MVDKMKWLTLALLVGACGPELERQQTEQQGLGISWPTRRCGAKIDGYVVEATYDGTHPLQCFVIDPSWQLHTGTIVPQTTACAVNMGTWEYVFSVPGAAVESMYTVGTGGGSGSGPGGRIYYNLPCNNYPVFQQ